MTPQTSAASVEHVLRGVSAIRRETIADYAVISHPGNYRPRMEDFMAATSNDDGSILFIAIFDGHGGPRVAKFLAFGDGAGGPNLINRIKARYLHDVAVASNDDDDATRERIFREVATEEFVHFERDVLHCGGTTAFEFIGSTATIVLIEFTDDGGVVTAQVASVGDSDAKCIWRRQRHPAAKRRRVTQVTPPRTTEVVVESISISHTPDIEWARIEKAGGFVTSSGRLGYGSPLTMGSATTLAMSRAFGDFGFKPFGVDKDAFHLSPLIVIPMVSDRITLISDDDNEDDVLLLVASDGLWNAPEDSLDFEGVLVGLIEQGQSLKSVLEPMCRQASNLSRDNTSVIALHLHQRRHKK
jgi:serine/threonine protein phosphatase PrpC